MYSTPDCMYCNQAKGWLNQNHFAFTDCDMTANQQCQQQYDDYGGNGTLRLFIEK
jgi:glutaredoxin